MATNSVSNRNISTSAACAVAQAAVEHASALGIAINVSVVDSAATEIAFLRMNASFFTLQRHFEGQGVYRRGLCHANNAMEGSARW